MAFNQIFKRSFPGKKFLSTQTDIANHVTSGVEKQAILCPFATTGNGKNHREATTEANDNVPLVQPFESIPGPKGLPIIGTLFDYMKKDGPKINKLFEAYRQRSNEFGPIYKETIASLSTVVVSDPVEYNKVIRIEGKYPVRSVMEPWHYYRKQKNVGQGLVNSNGPEWYKLRTASAKKMLKIQEVSEYCTDMSEVAEDFTQVLLERRNKDNEVVGLKEEVFKWAMESMGTFLFDSRIGLLGLNPPQQSVDFIQNLQGFFRLMSPLTFNFPFYKLFPTSEWRHFQSYADNVFRIGRSFVDKINEEKPIKPQRGEKSSFVQHIRSQESLNENEALSTVVDLLVGATETTSNACLWVIYCLARHPEVQEKLYNETAKVLPTGEKLTADKLLQLPYVKAVFKETLRLYPITFSTSRYMDKDIEIAGYNVPKGIHIQCNLYGVYRDSQYFPDPETFKPERWLKENQMDKDKKALSNLVWGHGARMCIGRRLAEQEIHILMTKIIQKFRLEYHHEPVEAILKTVMTPEQPLLISFIPRD
ncbi:cytochrome P450 10-like isoform X1 [Crassostrea angulata]|uniref:cytochrome P450 10-like isoform X1 n=2 Tax=Magallana angulata TaxID=2784310 RepID=UPI0022B0D901|nr:cytochrome P450 10-like isoform X1 [Crassostrea angulata]